MTSRAKAARGIGAALSGLLLSACVSPYAPYSPYVVEIQGDAGQAKLKADTTLCQGYSQDYSPGLSLGEISSGAIKGAATNAPGAAVNPLVPVIGAVGGATTALITGLDLLDDQRRRIVVECLKQKGNRTGLYLVLDPIE